MCPTHVCDGRGFAVQTWERAGTACANYWVHDAHVAQIMFHGWCALPANLSTAVAAAALPWTYNSDAYKPKAMVIDLCRGGTLESCLTAFDENKKMKYFSALVVQADLLMYVCSIAKALAVLHGRHDMAHRRASTGTRTHALCHAHTIACKHSLPPPTRRLLVLTL